ncbi:MAG TPA: hypothetical protein DCX07_09530 [Phycisphaerales bacterium]|nr:hypothetical protein [Phycisphaerales bacterium]
MIALQGRKVFIGGFHDHWARADAENGTLLLAALNYYHYDFCVLMDGSQACARWQQAAEAYSDGLMIYPGHEEGYGWGHVVTIGRRGSAPRSDEPDAESVLTRLRETSEMVFLAHPAYPTTWQQIVQAGRLDRIVDGGCVDGVELTVERFYSSHARNAELVRWYQAREQAGRATPIVGGWDMHMMQPLHHLSAVLYTNENPPNGHYETPCSNRTLVFAEENSLPAIKDAVIHCRTVIEEMPSGRLVGPRELVEFLERSGYREAIRERDRERDSITLEVPGRWVVGRPGRLRVSQPGRLRLPKTLTSAAPRQAGESEIAIPAVPTVLDRDSVYLPVSWRGADSDERIWGVEASHPIRLEILPWLDANGAAVELLPQLPFEGEVRLRIPAIDVDVEQSLSSRTLVPLDAAKGTDLPLHYELTATNASGLCRRYAGFLTFVGVRRFRDDWSRVPEIGVDRPEFVPKSAYGLGRPWPGAGVFSARLQFAWDDAAFRMRATVRDAVHYQPFRGHYAYNADCLQLGIDPMLRRKELIGNVYTFNLALTQDGAELYRGWAPTDEAGGDFQLPVPEVSLGDRYLRVMPVADGLVYELALPWSELAPVNARPGHRMGVYYIMFNNDGRGLLDTLHWPVPIYGMWLNPRKWGILTLLDAE